MSLVYSVKRTSLHRLKKKSSETDDLQRFNGLKTIIPQRWKRSNVILEKNANSFKLAKNEPTIYQPVVRKQTCLEIFKQKTPPHPHPPSLIKKKKRTGDLVNI